MSASGFHWPFYLQPKIVSEVQEAHNIYLLNKCIIGNYDIEFVEEPVNIKTWLMRARWNYFHGCTNKKLTADIKVASEIPN